MKRAGLVLLLLVAGASSAKQPQSFRKQLGRSFWKNSNASGVDYMTGFAIAAPAPECDGSTPSAMTGGEVLTFTRASSAYCTKGDGTMVSLSSGQPRISSLGFQAEGARTNLALNNNDISGGGWGGTATVTVNTGSGPWGATTLDTVDSVSNGLTRYQCPSVSSSAGPFTTSAFGQALSGTHAAALSVYCPGGRQAITCTCRRSNGGSCATQIIPGGQCVAVATQDTSGDFLEATATCSSATTQMCFEFWGGNRALAGQHRWGMVQFEAASFRSSPISTTGTAATRAAESLTFSPSINLDTLGCVRATANATQSAGAWVSSSAGYPLKTTTTAALVDDGTSSASASITSTLARYATLRSTWQASGIMAVYETSTAASASASFDGTMGSGAWQIGGKTAASEYLWGFIRDVRVGKSATGCK